MGSFTFSQFILGFLSLLLFTSSLVTALGQKPTIDFTPNNNTLLLATRSSSVNLVLDAADWPAVLRAANDVAVDFGRVTGLNGSVTATGKGTLNAANIFNVTGIDKDWSVRSVKGNGTSSVKGSGTIIVGTIGSSSYVDALVKSGKIDVSAIEGKWEAFVSVVIKDPINGTSEALVIAGSDRRGTIYGLYDVSEQIGVSPWYWFADVAPKSHDFIYALRTIKVQKSPTVRYRGFFINDEAPALTGWMNANYQKTKYGSAFGAEFYSHVFELLLRLRGNYLWPAMWGSMFNVDDPRNPPLADEYAIVMGSSHTEPMVRATKEWKAFGGTEEGWQWATNNASLYKFFTEGAERAKPYENVVTIGMRGYHDTAMSPDTQTDVLEAVVTAQEQILDEVYGDANKVPQMWCLYKEVQDYFEAGMKVPDHVILLWAEDNWQNIRRLPVGDEKKRSGGAGVYYHFDYVGDPQNYKWINTIQLQKTLDQMRLAVDRDADQLWIVNVGDIKPYEVPLSHWFDIAYDIDLWDEKSVPNWLEGWAARTFDTEHAKTIAEVVNTYSFLANMRKFELVEPVTYSILNYEEADKIIAQWQDISKKAQAVYDALPASQQASFFEMILHPVLAGGNFVDIQVSGARNQIYSDQGRNSANVWFQRVLDGMKKDAALTKQYHSLLNGKWNHMMDQTHLGYQGYWQQPMRQRSPLLSWVMDTERSLAGDMGVAVEGSNATVPGDDIWHSNGGGSLDLPAATPFTPQRWIDIFSVGTQPFNWKIAAEPFVKLSQSSGTISPTSNDVRIYIDVDWTQLPAGAGKKTVLNITSSTDYGTQYGAPTINLQLNNTALPSTFTSGFVESVGQVAFEAEHYTRLTPVGNLTYTILPAYGRTRSAVKLSDNNAEALTTSTAPGLEYDFVTFTPTTVAKGLNLTLILSPTLNINPKLPLAYVAQIDNMPQQRRQYVIDQKQGLYPVGWLEAVAKSAWTNTTMWGEVPAGKHTLKLWLVEANVVLQKVVLDLGGVKYSHNGPPESYRVGGANGT